MRVIWIELIPETFAKLVDNIAIFPKQHALQALLTDTDGESVQFHISEGDGEASSIFQLNEVHTIWPEVRMRTSRTFQTKTLISLLRENQIDAKKFPALVMDTQGSELLILKGVQEILRDFAFIKLEVADFEAYSGCSQLAETTQFLQENGFVEHSRHRFASDGKDRNYYDVVYQRRNFPGWIPFRLQF